MTGKVTTPDILDVLEHGQLEMEGLVSWGSNYTFLVHLQHESVQLHQCVLYECECEHVHECECEFEVNM